MSGPANISRTPVDLEEFEALLRRPHGGAAQAGDPLAELARLVEGQRSPFVKPQAAQAQPSAAPGHDDWDLRGSSHDGHPDMRGYASSDMNSARERAPGAYEQDPYAQNHYSQPSQVPPPPPGAKSARL